MKSLISLAMLCWGWLSVATPCFSQSEYDRCLSSACASGEIPCVYQCQEPELRFKFGIPIWLPEQHGLVAVRGRSAPVNISTRDDFKLLDDLGSVFAGRLDVNYGRWGVFADGLFYNVNVTQGILPRIDLTTGFSQAIVDFAGTYNVKQLINQTPWTQNWDALILVGGRYNLLDANQITITGPRGRSISRSGKQDWVDPIIGGQIFAPVTEDLRLSFRGDIGGFGIGSASQFTWNIEALAEFRCSDCLQLKMGYRLLDIDQRQGSGDNLFRYDVQLRGPIARIVLNF